MGEKRRVGCIIEMFEMLWNVRRLCQSWHCCYANFARVGRWEGMMEPSEGWGAATKENPRIKICTKRRLSTPCPHPWVHQHTTPWAGLVIYQPYPGQPTPAQPQHHGSPNSDPAPSTLSPGQWNYGTWPHLRPFLSFSINFANLCSIGDTMFGLLVTSRVASECDSITHHTHIYV